jgi:smad nuclear-interacting protein 1
LRVLDESSSSPKKHSSDRPRHDNSSRKYDRDRDSSANNDRDRKTSSFIPSKKEIWGNIPAEEEYEAANRAKEVPEAEKVKANFGLSGALAKDERTGNMFNGILLKWSEPLDAAPPTSRWRLFVFKEDKVVETLHIHRQSAYLAGREPKVADIVLLHPSCSMQHAVCI